MISIAQLLEFLLSFLSVLCKGVFFFIPAMCFWNIIFHHLQTTFTVLYTNSVPFFTHGTVGAPLACPFDRLVFRVCDEKLQDPT